MLSLHTPDMPASLHIARSTLHDELVERLRDMITEGDLPAGEKVNEKGLTEAFGVSRTPLREALKVLASEGLVTLMPNRGATVTKLTERDLNEVFPVLAVLEALAGELACGNMSVAEIAEVRKLHEAMVAQYKAGDLHGYFQTNQRIHDSLLEGSKNATLIAQHKNLAGRVRRARYMANLSRARWRNAVAEHEEILSALERRDGAALAPLLRAHLERKLETVRAWVRDSEAAS